jgi:deazaflavin-dependent oxidoreductase (nitroreductase family)
MHRMSATDQFSFRQKPRGVFKWFLHMPVWLFRARLGFLLGRRIVMLEHRGRRSGLLRRTPLETVRRDGDRYVLCSGTGPKADWYRNLHAAPAEALWVGAHRFPVTQRFLADAEAAAAFAVYEGAHPKAAARLTDMMGISYDGTDAGRVAMVAQIPMVELTLQRSPSA